MTDPVRLSLDSNAVDTPIEIWDEIIEVNLRGYLLGCKYAIPHMVRGGGGSIINTASDSGLAGNLGRIAYGMSKGGIITMTKYIATQYGRKNIRCNSIAPGIVLTEAMNSVAPKLKQIVKRHIFTQELGLPYDIAPLVAFLASDESRYITGENISISGGTLVHQPHYADLIDCVGMGG